MPYPISAVHSRRFVAAYADRMRMLFGASLIGYWPLWEASGATANDISPQANNGTYSNVTLAQAGIGDGRTSAQFVAASGSYLEVLTAGLVADFNGAAGTAMIWIKAANAGVWTSGVYRRMFSFRVDADNRVEILMDGGTPGIIITEYFGGGVGAGDTVDVLSTTNWFHIAITWDETANEAITYFNGISQGTSPYAGTFAGALANATIGAYSTAPASVWDGYLAHAILLNRAATAPEIAEAARATV